MICVALFPFQMCVILHIEKYLNIWRNIEIISCVIFCRIDHQDDMIFRIEIEI